jgi:proton-dependent oligopeptide transporter, POT family
MSTPEVLPHNEPNAKTWFGHPRLLALLFTTEMWERFGYYGMRALLILYMVDHFVFSDHVAGGLYGAFTSLVYLTPLIGGFIADQYIGSKKAVKTGAILMSIGYLMLAFTGGTPADSWVKIDGHRYEVQVTGSGPTAAKYVLSGTERYRIVGNEDKSITLDGARSPVPPRVESSHYEFGADQNPLNVMLLFASLAIVIVGNGFFKPNITTIVGALYTIEDRRRDTGYTIFYMGINLGSIISQFLAPLIAVKYGYTWGFALAGFGMVIAWARFQFSGKALEKYGNPPEGKKQRDFLFVVLTLCAVPVVWFLLNNSMISASVVREVAVTGVVPYLLAMPLLGKFIFAVFMLAIIGIPVWSLVTLPRVERNRMIVAVVLTCFAVVFFTLFEQAGSSLTLYAQRNTDLYIGSYYMPAGQVQIFNPIFIVLLAPLFSLLWNWLGKRGIEPSVPLKFAFGLILVGLGFLALVFGARFHDANFQVPLFWLVFAYLLHSLGELCLSPVGLSAVSKLSIQRLVGMMFGVWLLASAAAQYVAGIIAQAASTETVAGQVLNAQVSLETYMGVFQTIGYAGIISGVVMLVLWPLLKKGMHGIQ